MIRGLKPTARQRIHQQRGQAMIEYAIILILLVTLVLGGVELGIAAYSSSKISDAAKAGAQEFATFNAQNIGREAELKTDLTSLEYELVQLELQKSQLEAERATLEFQLAALEAQGALPETIQAKQNEIDAKQAEIGAPGTLEPPADPTGIFAQIANKQAEIIAKQTNDPDFLRLGDHDPVSNFDITMPACLPGNMYDDGLPPDRYVNLDTYPALAPEVGGGLNRIYLFNPLPIDVSSCGGIDDSRGGISRLSVLVNGYSVPFDNPDKSLNYPGLPKLNQAMYSMYSKACVADGTYFDCGAPAAPAPILKPPGKLCLSDTGEGCPTEQNDPLAPIAGYYFFGRSIDIGATPVFRPTFQIICGDTDPTTSHIMDGCFDVNGNPLLPPVVAVHTRYRAIFESFLTFGLQKLPDNSLLPYFYNPGGVNADGGRLIAAIGGEIGTASLENGEMRNTVKKFRDFRGCYSVNITTNQVSACN